MGKSFSFTKLPLLVLIVLMLISTTGLTAQDKSQSDIGFLIQLQPYIQAPVEKAALDIIAFCNTPNNIPVIIKDVQLFIGDAPNPFMNLKVNQVLKSFHGTNLPTEIVKEIVLPHPLNNRKFGLSQDQFYQNYGKLLTVLPFSLDLKQIFPDLSFDQVLQIRAEATVINGGKPEIYTAITEATYMAPLVIPGLPGEFSLLADSYNSWYRADGHVHTNWSDGNQTISEAAQGGYNAGLSTVIITDHGDHFDPKSSNYKKLGSWQDQRNYILNNTFALPIINGQEVTEDPEFITSSHYLAYDLKSWVYNDIYYNYGGGDLYNPNEQPLVDAVNQNNPPYSCGGPAHPGLDVYPWNGMEESGMTFMEVFDSFGGLDGESMKMWDEWNAAHLSTVLNNSEKFIAATANSDGHKPTDVGKYSTYFYSPGGVSSTNNFFNAIRSRQVVASQTPSFGYWTLNGSPMSSVIELTKGQELNFSFIHVPRGYAYNYVSRVLIIKNDSTNTPQNINIYPDSSATTSSYTIRPGDFFYPTKDGYYRISIEFKHKSSYLGLYKYSWTICQPIFFRLK